MQFWLHSAFDMPTNPTFGFTDTSNFGEPDFVAGRSSPRAAHFNDTGFGFQGFDSQLPGAQGTVWGFAYKPMGALGRVNAIMTVTNTVGLTSTVVFQIKTRLDHKLDFLAGPLLTTFTSTTSFALDTWHYIEIQFDYNGDTKIYVDDVLDTDTNVTNDPTKPPTAYGVGWSNLGTQGWAIDDHYVGAGAGEAYIQRLGPVRITSFYMASDVVTGWGRVGGSSNSACVADRYGVTSSAPDNDSSYVQTAFPAIKDLYRVAPAQDCKGRVLAVGVNMVAKAPSGGTPTLNALVRPDLSNSAVYSVDPVTAVLGSGYVLYRAYTYTNPRTGTFWTDGEIENAGWGFVAGGTGAVRVTMFWIDKIQLLRNVPFTCGQLSSYNFNG